MADGPDLDLQKALIAALRADAGVAALVGSRIYDEPPQAVVFPYVRLGRVEVAPLRMDCATDHDIAFAIEVHSRPTAGRVEAARIAHAVRVVIEAAPLTMAHHRCDWVLFVTQAVTRNADGQSYVATIAFEAALADA